MQHVVFIKCMQFRINNLEKENKMQKELREVQVPIAVTKSENQMIIDFAKKHKVSKTEVIIQAVKFAVENEMP